MIIIRREQIPSSAGSSTTIKMYFVISTSALEASVDETTSKLEEPKAGLIKLLL